MYIYFYIFFYWLLYMIRKMNYRLTGFLHFRLNQINEDVYASSNVWKIYTLSYMHYNSIGLILGIVIGLVVSMLFPTDQKVDPKLLSPCIRNLVYPDYKAREKSNETISEECT